MDIMKRGDGYFSFFSLQSRSAAEVLTRRRGVRGGFVNETNSLRLRVILL